MGPVMLKPFFFYTGACNFHEVFQLNMILKCRTMQVNLKSTDFHLCLEMVILKLTAFYIAAGGFENYKLCFQDSDFETRYKYLQQTLT